MPTIFSHAIFAAAAGKAAVKKNVVFGFRLLTAACAMLPDADVLAASVFDIERGGIFAHRGFTHSIIFALLSGSLAALFADKFLRVGISYLKLFAYFTLAVLTHPLLDMLTDGGSGIALFAPFTNARFFFPWRPVEVSPIGLRFFSDRGLDVILSEIIWIWLPSAIILLTAAIVRKLRKGE